MKKCISNYHPKVYEIVVFEDEIVVVRYDNNYAKIPI